MKRTYKVESAYIRMMRRVDVPKDKSECWLWTGPVNNAGYGMIRGNDGVPKMMTVHRVAAKEKGLNIRHREIQHTCLTKNCVNPDHLVEGTPKTRTARIIAKHGKNFSKPKEPYKTCKHCKGTSHIVWFSRMHGDCHTQKGKKKV